MIEPKILVLDIETAPLLIYAWGLGKQLVTLDQLKKDWHLLAWAAKWVGDSKVHYMDNRDVKDIKNDRHLLQGLIRLLNQADIVVTQNGEHFDLRKINARAAIQKLRPIKPVASTDILKEGRKVFGFTSHKLEYISDQLNTKYKKLKHKRFPGLELWKEVLKNNYAAWQEMKRYNIQDVLATEEAYLKIQGWIKTQAISSFYDDTKMRCRCGNTHLHKRGFAWTDAGKYQIYHCTRRTCGKWSRSPINLLSAKKRRHTLREYQGGRS